ncbi:MAG: magnesium transporter [Phycisphaerae bacterium]|nr:magnesium transporter [Phycisphaerae bacterium]
MEEAAVQANIHEWIESRQFGRVKAVLTEMDVHDVTDLLRDLHDARELGVAFRMLPTDRAAEVLSELEPDRREELLATLSSSQVSDILNEMPPDDRTELLEELPGSVAQRLMNQLTGEQRTVAMNLLAYPEDSIGRLMTPEYVAVRKHWTVDRVLRQIRRMAGRRETIYVVYVVDNDWKLQDDLDLEDVVRAEPEQEVSELMDEQCSWLVATDDQETAVEAFKKYDALALPVVDGKGILVGIVTFDDVMDVQEEESTEDMQRMAGLVPLEESYLSASFGQMLKKRLPWLGVLLVMETLAVIVLKGFEQMLAMLAMFMPLINATAGNTGNQVASLMIRGFAVAEITPRDWWRVLLRELLRGVCMGAILAGIAGGIVTMFHESPAVALAVGLAMLASVALANMIGAMLPFLFRRVGVDPAVTSGPFIACLMDVGSILIFFSIAGGVLRLVK